MRPYCLDQIRVERLLDGEPLLTGSVRSDLYRRGHLRWPSLRRTYSLSPICELVEAIAGPNQPVEISADDWHAVVGSNEDLQPTGFVEARSRVEIAPM